VQYSIDNTAMSFNCRFGGVPMDVYVPIEAIMGIYARENGQGMIFDMDDGGPESPNPGNPEPPKDRPSLKVVK
jgi:stringent starvation protein B